MKTFDQSQINTCIEQVKEKFPFKGYMDDQTSQYNTVIKIISHYAAPSAKILDLGCGPGDQTAILSSMGYDCYGFDDLKDPWHLLPGNREKIIAFMKSAGVKFSLANDYQLPYQDGFFDIIESHGVIEHLHDSPCNMLNNALTKLKPGGLLIITVPNAVNVRKRIAVAFGKTNLPPFDQYYWTPGRWRGHVREYVYNDLKLIAGYLNLTVVELRGCDCILQRVPTPLRSTYVFITNFFDGLKDSWVLVAKKNNGWIPRLENRRYDIRVPGNASV